MNLLPTLHALLVERSVTGAARVLGMTPSGVSRALSRLRVHFGDDLLVRDGRQMTLTPVAEALAPTVARLLDEVRRLTEPGVFLPQTDAWTVRIAGSDYFEHALMPSLVSYLATAAPRVAVHHVKSARFADDLVDGQVDLIVALWGDVDAADISGTRLVEDRLVCVMRRDHALAEEPLTVANYAAQTHVLVAPGGQPGGSVDRVLAEQGLTRRVAVLTSTFAAALPIVASTPYLTALPVGLAETLAPRWPVVVRELPFALRPFVLGAYWSARLRTNPAHRWFRSLLRTYAATGRWVGDDAPSERLG